MEKLWPIQFYANGELNAWGDLTDQQITLITKLIKELGGDLE